jgi:hypothetical protein
MAQKDTKETDAMTAALNEALPIHPRTGRQAVGIVGGRPVWPILGGSGDGQGQQGQKDTKETDDTDDDLDLSEEDAKRLLEGGKDQSKDDGDKDDPKDRGKDSEDDDEDPEGADKLSDAGTRALARIKEQRRQARADRDQLKQELQEVRDRLKKHDDKDKTETQRLTEERDSLKERVEKAEGKVRRREAAEEYAPDHATPAQIRAVAKRLNGATDEDLKADAEELYALVAPAPTTSKQMPGKPKERLRGGGDPDNDQGETDPAKILARIPRNR